jgi:cold shock CspA family protein
MSTFEKREREKKRQQKQQEKSRRREARKASGTSSGLENMMAYVDENGRITSTPPDPSKRKPIDASEIQIGVPPRVDETVVEHAGRVDVFETSRGFGFIREDGSQERFFFHVSGLLEEVAHGDKVNFDVEQGPKGPNAVRVRKASSATPSPAPPAGE